jgi:5-hydroxyisourate hydrolase
MTGRLTVHVLDTASGAPARGMSVGLFRIEGDARLGLGTFVTNDDGRCEGPLLEGIALQPGLYELVFAVIAWRRVRGDADPGFYDDVPIRFRIVDATAHYHVPLLIAPYGYSTYRGS